MALLEYYLTLKLEKAGRVKGDSSCKGYEDDIIIESFSWSEKWPDDLAAAVMRDQGTIVGDFKFKMKSNKASPVLLMACYNSDIMQEAVLKCCRDTSMGKQEFMKWTLKLGGIKSYEMAGTTEEVLPLDQFTIGFAQLTMDFKPQLADRSLGPAFSAQFDIGQGTESHRG
jgi:type VI secretion system secreted protein Hcp